MSPAPYMITAFREDSFGIEALVTLNGEAVTIVTGCAPYDARGQKLGGARGVPRVV